MVRAKSQAPVEIQAARRRAKDDPVGPRGADWATPSLRLVLLLVGYDWDFAFLAICGRMAVRP